MTIPTVHAFGSIADPAFRQAIHDRQGGFCLRCYRPLREAGRFELHHRIRRRILGDCACNIVALHPRCHTQGPLAVHDHPDEARGLGLIVSSYGDLQPALVPVEGGGFPWHGPVLLTCDGGATSPSYA